MNRQNSGRETKWNSLNRAVSFVLLASFAVAPRSADAAKVTSIDFKGTQSPNIIEIQGDGPLTFDKQVNAADNQVIIDIKDATLAKSASRKLDTSSFNSKVQMISPYQVTENGDGVRVVIQMKSMADVEATQAGNSISISVPGDSSADSAAAVAEAPSTPAASTEAAPSSEPPATDDVALSKARGASEVPPAAASEESTGTQGQLDSFIANRDKKKFTGRPITLQVRDSELVDVFRLIGEASGFNIVMGDDVRGKVTLSMVDVPWDQVLDVILQTHRLGAERNNNLLRIATLSNLTIEKQEQLAAKNATLQVTPRITRIFPISYANLTDLGTILTNFASGSSTGVNTPTVPGVVAAIVPGAPPAVGVPGATPAAGGAAAAAPAAAANHPGNSASASSTGVVQTDKRTNSLIVRDIPENVERMKKLIEILDTQTPQIMIEAKVIEATEEFGKTINGNLGVAFGNTSGAYLAGVNGGSAGNLLGSLPNPASLGAQGAQFILTPTFGFFGSNLTLNAILSLQESESRVKVVASPKTVVLDREAADILVGTPIRVPAAPTAAGVSVVDTTAIQNANLQMSVTPSVTNEGSVLLDLTLSRDTVQDFGGGLGAPAARRLKTRVLVESGTTLVIGGIYTSQENSSKSGLPFLRKLPVIGYLFGRENETSSKAELFFFITPRILNPKEAGLNG